jgi:mannose-6-phosphate isomerase-like protein (cupin superfamily)
MDTKPDSKFLLDPYLDWAKSENVPIVDVFAVNLHKIETAPWKRLGGACRGAFLHLTGRGDFLSLHVIEIPPGEHSGWLRHVYDEVFFVLSGHGSAQVEARPDAIAEFEFGPNSLFAPPLNAPFRLFNTSGHEPVRVVSTNNAPLWINLAHDERFIFDNDFVFEQRAAEQKHFSGEGEFIPLAPGKHMWETNFVPDLCSFELHAWESRGSGSKNIKFILADGVMHAHCSEMAVGTYKKAHRHGAGAHVFAISGSGYTLMWNEGDQDFMRHEWNHGFVFAPPDGMFHQHFNTAPKPARYLACSLGSHRYPMTAAKRSRKESPESDAKKNGLQIDYADQDPRIHAIWLEESAATGVGSKMGDIFDEAKFQQKVS